jgi:hypothetical protein
VNKHLDKSTKKPHKRNKSQDDAEGTPAPAENKDDARGKRTGEKQAAINRDLDPPA